MIKPLSEDLRNKISAGEVVEGPSSIVKELIENSLDAGSTDIIVVVEKGGQTLIQIRDNGSGIPPDQLKFSILRYHTSKISSLENLFAIETLGFRGEALSSIGSVSEMNIISSCGDNIGAELKTVNGKVEDIIPAASINGTEITIKNLANLILKIANYKAKIILDTKMPDGTPRKILDSSRIFKLGWSPKISLDRGLKYVYDMYDNNMSIRSWKKLHL